MPKWIAIRAAAVLALAGSAAALAMSVAAVAFLLFFPLRNTGLLTPSLVRISGCVMAAVFAASAVWGVCAGIGVLRRRNWARISMVVFGGLLAFFGGTGALAMILVPFPMNPDVDQRVAALTRAFIVASYVAFTAIGIVTPDPASVESILSWAARLQDRVNYVVVENAMTHQADFSYWRDSEQAKQFRTVFQPVVLTMEFRLPELENPARQHGVTLGQIAERRLKVPELQRASLVIRAQSYRRRLFEEIDKAKALLLP